MDLTRPTAAVVAVLGAGSVAAGTWMVYPPAGLIVGGVEAVAAAYVTAYLRAARPAKPKEGAR